MLILSLNFKYFQVDSFNLNCKVNDLSYPSCVSLNPLANGLWSIFSCVICTNNKTRKWIYVCAKHGISKHRCLS